MAAALMRAAAHSVDAAGARCEAAPGSGAGFSACGFSA